MTGKIIYNKKFISVILMMLMSVEGFCQPRPVEPVPITGIEWLLGAGALFGIKKIVDRFRKGN